MRTKAEIRNDLELIESQIRASVDKDEVLELLPKLYKLMDELELTERSK